MGHSDLVIDDESVDAVVSAPIQGELIPAGTASAGASSSDRPPSDVSGDGSVLASLPALLASDSRALADDIPRLSSLLNALDQALLQACDAFQYAKCHKAGALLNAASQHAGSRELEVLARELIVRSEYELSLVIPRFPGGRGKKANASAYCGFTRRQVQRWRERYGGLSRQRLDQLLFSARQSGCPVRLGAIDEAAKADRRKEGIPLAEWFLRNFRRPLLSDSDVHDRLEDVDEGPLSLPVKALWIKAARKSGLCVDEWILRTLDEQAAS